MYAALLWSGSLLLERILSVRNLDEITGISVEPTMRIKLV